MVGRRRHVPRTLLAKIGLSPKQLLAILTLLAGGGYLKCDASKQSGRTDAMSERMTVLEGDLVYVSWVLESRLPGISDSLVLGISRPYLVSPKRRNMEAKMETMEVAAMRPEPRSPVKKLWGWMKGLVK